MSTIVGVRRYRGRGIMGKIVYFCGYVLQFGRRLQEIKGIRRFIGHFEIVECTFDDY